MRAYPRTPAQQRVCSLAVGEVYLHPRTDPKFAIYVANVGRRQGRKFKTRACEFGRRVERLK